MYSRHSGALAHGQRLGFVVLYLFAFHITAFAEECGSPIKHSVFILLQLFLHERGSTEYICIDANYLRGEIYVGKLFAVFESICADLFE